MKLKHTCKADRVVLKGLNFSGACPCDCGRVYGLWQHKNTSPSISERLDQVEELLVTMAYKSAFMEYGMSMSDLDKNSLCQRVIARLKESQ